MALAFDATDTRTRRFWTAGNSCYINSTLQALFALPPVQRLYEGADLSRHLSRGARRDDGQIDGDICMATVYREARLATKKLQPMSPRIFLEKFHQGCKLMSTNSSNGFRTALVASPRAYWNFSKGEIDHRADAVHVYKQKIYP